MSDDLLRELMSSPLDDGPRRSSGAATAGTSTARWSPGWFVIAVGVGAAAVAAGWTVGRSDSPVVTSTTSTTFTAAFDGSPSGLPESYTALDDRLGIRAERILQRPDGTFVTFSTVAVNALDSDATTGFQGGLWTLILEDGTEIQSTTEGYDPLAQGAVSVFFPPAEYTIEEISGIGLSGTAMRLVNQFELAADSPTRDIIAGTTVAEVPLAGSRIALDEGVFVEFSPVSLGAAAAFVDWTLTGDTRANAFVSGGLTARLPDGQERTLGARTPTSTFSFFHPSVPAPPLVYSGRITFDADTVREVEYPAGTLIQLSISVVWAVYEPGSVTIPLDGVATALVR